MKKILIGASLLSVVALASCGVSKKTLNLDNAAGTQSILIKQGKTYDIKVTENPSTGYSWYPQLSDNCAAKIESSDYKQNKAPEGMVGVAGVRTIILKGEKEGTCRLTLNQSRGNQGEVINTKDVIIKVVK